MSTLPPPPPSFRYPPSLRYHRVPPGRLVLCEIPAVPLPRALVGGCTRGVRGPGGSGPRCPGGRAGVEARGGAGEAAGGGQRARKQCFRRGARMSQCFLRRGFSYRQAQTLRLCFSFCPSSGYAALSALRQSEQKTCSAP